MNTSSRKDAHARGETQFFTGKPCKNGHVSARYVSTGGCIECLRQYSGAFRTGVAPGVMTFPAQAMHIDDHAQLYVAVDYLNAQRGLPPAVRAGADAVAPSEFEKYLQKEMRKPLPVRPPLHDIERAAGVLGLAVEYRTMARPVDTWSTRGPAVSLAAVSTNDPAVRAANEAHNAALLAAEGAQAHPDVEARKAAMARALEADGYLPGEQKTT